jgi:hypothetical protein
MLMRDSTLKVTFIPLSVGTDKFCGLGDPEPEDVQDLPRQRMRCMVRILLWVKLSVVWARPHGENVGFLLHTTIFVIFFSFRRRKN